MNNNGVFQFCELKNTNYSFFILKFSVFIPYHLRPAFPCSRDHPMKNAFLYSLKSSIPVMISFFPVGVAYGILMQTSGYGWGWTAGTSIFVFAGSLQYLMVSFLTGTTPLLTVAVMALLLNSRHIFYGIPFIEKWKKYGFWRYFLIFALPDETFSLHCANDYDDGSPAHKRMTYVFTAALVYAYWIVFSVAGALIGQLFLFRTDGIDFAMTALFIVILLEQLRESASRIPAAIALCSALVCLIVLGPDAFILPALLLTVVILLLLRPRLEVQP